MGGRWSNYYIDPEFEHFWRRRLAKENASVCVILGVGFDPRSLTAIEKLNRCAVQDRIEYLALYLVPTGNSSSNTELLTRINQRKLDNLASVARLANESIALRDDEGHFSSGHRAVQFLHNWIDKLTDFQDVIVDISGLPRTIFYPIISFLCKRASEGKISNLHVAVTEDPAIDQKIRGIEYGKADYIQYFHLEQGDQKLIWLPVIGCNESDRLQKIHTLIEANCNEICPILPFPAKSLRLVDDVIVQLRDVLLEKLVVSTDNFLLCDERNPFDIYRKIIQVDDYYQKQLNNLPGFEKMKTVVTPLAGKMLSLGMLLAAIERKLAVAYIEAGAYQVEIEPEEVETHPVEFRPVEIWLTGEAYE